jgi:hypothetical protein
MDITSDQVLMAAMRAARRRDGVSFIVISDVLLEEKLNGARVVDLQVSRSDEESPIADITIKQHYGALCGQSVTVGEEGMMPCGLTPGHAGEHHPWGGSDQ